MKRILAPATVAYVSKSICFTGLLRYGSKISKYEEEQIHFRFIWQDIHHHAFTHYLKQSVAKKNTFKATKITAMFEFTSRIRTIPLAAVDWCFLDRLNVIDQVYGQTDHANNPKWSIVRHALYGAESSSSVPAWWIRINIQNLRIINRWGIFCHPNVQGM